MRKSSLEIHFARRSAEGLGFGGYSVHLYDSVSETIISNVNVSSTHVSLGSLDIQRTITSRHDDTLLTKLLVQRKIQIDPSNIQQLWEAHLEKDNMKQFE
jgi:hypothetical protein